MSLRRRLAHSRPIQWIGAAPLVLWIRLCLRTTRWTIKGLEELKEALAEGPVIFVCWHEHLMMAIPQWPYPVAPLSGLRAHSPIAKVAGLVQESFGMMSVEMTTNASNIATSRQVLRSLRDGISVGLTADGPSGPARIAKGPPIDWTRASGRPVYLVSFAGARQRRIGSWDRMVLPMPFDRGVVLYRRWQTEVPRQIDADQRDSLCDDLSQALEALRIEAETEAGLSQPAG